MDEKAIRAIQGRPFRNCWIVHAAVGWSVRFQCTTRRADVEDDEDVQPLKGGGHHDEEVAGEYGAGMIVEERGP